MEFLTTEEVAKILRKSTETIRRMCRNKKIPAQRVGRDWLIYKGEFEKQFMNKG